MFIFTGSSHDIVESSHYFPHDRSHYRHRFEFGSRFMVPKKTDDAK